MTSVMRQFCCFCGNDVWIPYNETECCQICGVIKFDRYTGIIYEYTQTNSQSKDRRGC